MARADIKAGRAYVELYVQKSAFLRGMNEARKQLNAFGDDMLSVGKKLAAFGATVAAGLTAATARFVSFGDQLDKASARTGIAASRLAALGFAAEQSGTNLETVEAAIRRMQRVITDASTGSKSAADALGLIGIASKDIEGLKPDEQFTRITEALGAIEDPTKRAAVAMQIFGRSGTMLLPMLGSVQALVREAGELGIVPLEKDVKAAAALGDAFNRMKRSVLGVFFEIGAAIEPLIREVVDFGTVFVATMVKFVRANREAILAAIKFGFQLSFLVGSIIAVGIAAKAAAASLGLMMAIFSGPRVMAWAAAAIVAATVAMQGLGSETARTYDLMLKLAQGGQITKSWELTVQQMRVMWLEFTSSVPNAWNEMIRAIAKSVSRIQGFFGYDAEGAMKLIDKEFNEQQRKILADLMAAQNRLAQLQADAVNSLRSPGSATTGGAAGSMGGAIGTLQATGQRQIGTFSAAAFRAEQGGIDFEIKAQIDAIKKATEAIDRGSAQNHADLIDLSRIVQKSGVVFG